MTVGIHKRNSGHVNMGTVTLGRRVFIVKEARVRDHLVGGKKEMSIKISIEIESISHL